MKDFMLIFIGADYEELGLSPDQLQERMGKWFAWVEKLQQKGVYKGGEALLSKAKRISGKDRIVSDGPFVESKELIGGYFLVSAQNEEEAMQMAAADFPDYDIGGAVEIREVAKFDN